MAANEIHLGDIGTVFVVTVKDGSSTIDISGATTKQIILVAPDGGKLTKTASFTTDGTDGKMQYAAVSGDLDEAGWWKLQGRVVLTSGTWSTDITRFEVHQNL